MTDIYAEQKDQKAVFLNLYFGSKQDLLFSRFNIVFSLVIQSARNEETREFPPSPVYYSFLVKKEKKNSWKWD